MDYKALIDQEAYDFLKIKKDLSGQILYLTLSGSIGYGTNTAQSDYDLRGFSIERLQVLYGLEDFEQYEESTTDTVIYGLKKFVRLALKGNPNILELLGTETSHIVYMHPLAKRLRDNRTLFLSQRIVATFGNYAMAQLRRLQNALARDHYPNDEKQQHILNALNRQMTHFKRVYTSFDKGSIALEINKKTSEIIMDIELKHYPLKDFINIYSEMSNILKDYSKLNSRNKKKDIYKLNKHAMHLIRLLIMGTEMLETGEINTFRHSEHALLMQIKNGELSMEEFYRHLNKYEARFKYASENTKLPLVPDEKAVQDLMMSIYSDFYK